LKAATLKILTVFIALLILFAAFLLIHGNYITMYYKAGSDISAGEVKVTFDKEGVAEVRDIRVKDRLVRVDFQKVSKGETTASVKIGESTYMQPLNANGPLIIDEGKNTFPCWQLFLLSGFILSLVSSGILLAEYRKLRETELFSYNPIYMLGLFIFFSVIALGTGILLLILLLNPESFNFSNILVWLRSMMLFFTLLTAPILIVFAAALAVSNIQLIRKEGFKKVNVLGIILAALIVFGMAFGILLYNFLIYRTSSASIDNFVLNTYYAVFSLFVSLLLAVFIIFFRTARHSPTYDKDYIVILGCRLKPDGTLYPLVRGRVDRAMEFAAAQEAAGGPAPIFIPSGGKGGNEPVAEGEGMANYLIESGIPKERVFPETESKNTKENMRFSKAIAEKIKPDAKGIFSTTNYHVFRSGIIAKKEGIELDGVGAKTKWYFWPNALIREFIGLLVDDIKEIVLLMLVITAVCAFLAFLL
jgi:uncharacterized SAM-binding protein YcdF (DUF218 family)